MAGKHFPIMLRIILLGTMFLLFAACVLPFSAAMVDHGDATLAIIMLSFFGSMWAATGLALRDAIRMHILLLSTEQSNRNRQP